MKRFALALLAAVFATAAAPAQTPRTPPKPFPAGDKLPAPTAPKPLTDEEWNKLLEDALGLTLFSRSPGGMALTESGARLLAATRDAMRLIHAGAWMGRQAVVLFMEI